MNQQDVITEYAHKISFTELQNKIKKISCETLERVNKIPHDALMRKYHAGQAIYNEDRNEEYVMIRSLLLDRNISTIEGRWESYIDNLTHASKTGKIKVDAKNFEHAVSLLEKIVHLYETDPEVFNSDEVRIEESFRLCTATGICDVFSNFLSWPHYSLSNFTLIPDLYSVFLLEKTNACWVAGSGEYMVSNLWCGENSAHALRISHLKSIITMMYNIYDRTV